MAYNENASRAPENADALDWISRALDYWSSEYYRRRNDKEELCPAVELAPFPRELELWKQERERLKKLFAEHIYGEIPPAPDQLEYRLLSEKSDALNNTAIRREIRIYCRMDDGRCHDFDMLLYIPKQVEKPPVFVGLNFDGNQANTPEDDVRLTRGPGRYPGRWWRTAPTGENIRHIKPESWNFAETIARGYAVATANYGEIFPDNPCGYEKSIYTLFHSPEELTAFPALPAELKNFGAISAWAWGLSRMLDVLEKTGGVDADKAAIIGHSRLGKTALWAGANDERFKLVISNNSGHGGAAPSRHILGETLTMLWCIRSNWFCGNMARYAGLEKLLPIDQHQLLALIAPRSVYVGSSSLDVVADPKGEFISAKTASKVWELYQLKGLEEENMPPENQSIGNVVGYHVKTGKHSLTAYDWIHYYNHADKVFGKQQ